MNIKHLGYSCSGCGACYNLCPVNAISMEEDSEGFKYPVIDEEKCTNCGLCTKSCPVANPKYENEKEPKCFAYMANDEIRKNSASGGAFAQLANLFIQDGGYVVGVVYTKEWGAEHIVSNKVEDIARMQSSKYFQSDMTQCYKQIKQILEENIKVLFSGTPCQVAGLKAFLRKDYDNLYCLDLICHGVPSPKLFKKYLDETYGLENVKEYNFRSKEKNGWSCTRKIKLINGTEFEEKFNEDIYCSTFLKNLLLRKSCETCPFNKLPRQGDISIGDYWGINDYNKKYNDKKGTSIILENNINKGTFLLSLLKKISKLTRKMPLNTAIPKNQNIIRASYFHKKRDFIYSNLDKMSFSENVDFAIGNKADCMILNLWGSVNYGAILTCLGVQSLMEKLGYNAKIVNYVPKINRNFEDSFADKFSKKYLNLSTPIKDYGDLLALNESCENFIVGSDQVWNGLIMKNHAIEISSAIWLLNYANTDKRKIAYSASLGHANYVLDKEMENLFEYYLPQFDSISIREDDGVNIIKDHFGIDTTQLIDGAFHIPMSLIDEITKDYPKKDDYIACFSLPYFTHKQWYKKLMPAIEKKYGLPIKYFEFDKNISVEEWIAFIKNSNLVITDSYHATVFSILFEKKFIQIQNARTQSRFNSLYRLLEMENLAISEDSKDIDIDKLLVDRDWSKIKSIYQKEVEKAEQWTKEALEKPIKDKDKYAVSNQLITDAHFKTKELEKLIQFSMQKDVLKKKYYTAKVLSKITFGKTRKKYKELRNQLKPIYSELRKCSKFNIENFIKQ